MMLSGGIRMVWAECGLRFAIHVLIWFEMAFVALFYPPKVMQILDQHVQ